ncbi:hypothetical protein HY490_00950 [Candidatus Woesearchaeota archaeon]|nr:hypothetical protein [Candidatus Woesearchaeota archaeon]
MSTHAGLLFGLVALVAVMGLMTTVEVDTPRGLIDYPETVEGCAGGWILSERQVEGKSKYVDYKSDTAELHCYDYYTTLKPLGSPASEKPTAGRCYKQKCCWREVPLDRVKHPPTQRRMFDSVRSWFRYSPVAEAKRKNEVQTVPWICNQ